MFRLAASLLVLAAPSHSLAAAERALPTGVEIISQNDAASCRFIDIISASETFVLRKAESASREALVKALEKAKLKGANRAVMGGVAASNKELVVTLTAYSCVAG